MTTKMIEFDVEEDVDFEDLPVTEVVARLTQLCEKYEGLTFRMDYSLGYSKEGRRLYLAAKRPETEEELADRLLKETRKAEQARAMAERQVKQLRASYPDLF